MAVELTPSTAGETPAAPAVGALVTGPPTSPRQVVRWDDQYRDSHELAPHFDPDAEGYLSLYNYPPAEYVPHFLRAGHSPRGYSGSAGCRFLVFDIDRVADLDAALADARTVTRFLLRRYGPAIDDGLAAYFSGGKGFHVVAEFRPGSVPRPHVPAACKRLALRVAAAAGVRIDTACYDHQRLVRLPNSRHPRTGLHKRFLTPDELFALDIPAIRELARHPAAFGVPASGECVGKLEDDWLASAAESPTHPVGVRASGYPVVPKFVLDFIGFGDVQDPGRAVTLFRCSAALKEACERYGVDAVIAGLLAEPALKSGLEVGEVEKQIRDGLARGRRAGGDS